MRVIEAASFVAAPSAGLYLAQFGADVIRVDQRGGGPDHGRWPQAPNGASLYWEGLNKGKRSLCLDLGCAEGRELLQELVTAPGDEGGLFLTNFPANGFLAHDALARRRPDLVTTRVMGTADGGNALDYTVNCAVGIPQITGPASLGAEPVNHVLPAWDLLTGAYAAFALLAAERHRRDTGAGKEIRIPLMDVGLATLSNLGLLAEALTAGDRPRYGNDLYGAFGRDYVTADGIRIMVVAITGRQWKGLIESLGIGERIAAIERACQVSFDADEGARFRHLDTLVPIFQDAIGARTLAVLVSEFERLGVCWGLYQTVRQAAESALVRDNPIFSTIKQVSGLTYPVAGAAATIPQFNREEPVRAPRLGEHSEAILADVLGLSQGTIGKLRDRGIVE